MATKPKQPAAPRLIVDTIAVQVLVREFDPTTGVLGAPLAGEPLVFKTEDEFREWAAKPFTFTDQRQPE